MTTEEIIIHTRKMIQDIINNPGKVNIEKTLIAVCKNQLFILEKLRSKNNRALNDIFPWMNE